MTLSDTLPTNAGLSWSIASQGAGWNGTCAIAAGELTCGPVTVPAGTTQAASTFTVHITSPTTGATGGDCPETGVVDNTGSVTTTNDGIGRVERFDLRPGHGRSLGHEEWLAGDPDPG